MRSVIESQAQHVLPRARDRGEQADGFERQTLALGTAHQVQILFCGAFDQIVHVGKDKAELCQRQHALILQDTEFLFVFGTNESNKFHII